MGVAEQMLADWLCFAYDGRPGPKFPEVPKVLVYGKEETRTEEDDWRADEMAFWAAIKGKNG